MPAAPLQAGAVRMPHLVHTEDPLHAAGAGETRIPSFSLSLSLPLGSERPSKFPSLRIVWAPVSFLFYNNSLVENAFLVENITCWR
jgi:hypothetical protein